MWHDLPQAQRKDLLACSTLPMDNLLSVPNVASLSIYNCSAGRQKTVSIMAIIHFFVAAVPATSSVRLA